MRDSIVEKILNERSLILPEPYYLPGNNEMMYDVEHRKSDLDNTIKIVKNSSTFYAVGGEACECGSDVICYKYKKRYLNDRFLGELGLMELIR